MSSTISDGVILNVSHVGGESRSFSRLTLNRWINSMIQLLKDKGLERVDTLMRPYAPMSGSTMMLSFEAVTLVIVYRVRGNFISLVSLNKTASGHDMAAKLVADHFESRFAVSSC